MQGSSGLGDVGALGLEAEFIGDVGDGVGDTVVADVGVLAADLDGLTFGAQVLQLTFGGH